MVTQESLLASVLACWSLASNSCTAGWTDWSLCWNLLRLQKTFLGQERGQDKRLGWLRHRDGPATADARSHHVCGVTRSRAAAWPGEPLPRPPGRTHFRLYFIHLTHCALAQVLTISHYYRSGSFTAFFICSIISQSSCSFRSGGL